ncbi:MAG: double-strand break repair protein AddB [Pseudomonadota bacterium]
MFDETETPRVFYVPLGVPFADGFLDGLLQRSRDQEELARTEIIVASGRMATALTDALKSRCASLIPKLIPVSALKDRPDILARLPEGRSTLERQLGLAQAIGHLADRTGALASQSARFALAQTLDSILGDFHRSRVPLSALSQLDLTHVAEHWSLSQSFLGLLEEYLSSDLPLDADARQVFAIDEISKDWADAPPSTPVLIAGSTGSRPDTLALMKAASRLPEGAVVLPGWDSDLPGEVRNALGQAEMPANHPQSALAQTAEAISGGVVHSWVADDDATRPGRKLWSLALRPAPVTDQWLREGPAMASDLPDATRTLSLMESDTPRHEALSIALCLRETIETQTPAVLITPDRTLTRQVTARLSTWGITPDDSAGRPLQQTPPGVFLRLTAGLIGKAPETKDIVAVLKHPLAISDREERGDHLLQLRTLEATILRSGPPELDIDAVATWIADHKPNWRGWWRWISETICMARAVDVADLGAWANAHLALATKLSRGRRDHPDPEIWEGTTGSEALAAMQHLSSQSNAAGKITRIDYLALVRQVLSQVEVREVIGRDPRIAIWGTLEARNTSRPFVILGGLNEGVWPSLPTPDPWLNRSMRAALGLPSPERTIGLSAHDFCQSVHANRVVLSRAKRDGDAPTVPSRWILRLTNLLQGLGDPGQAALTDMRARAQPYLDLATTLDRQFGEVLPAAPRPAPVPPVAARPRKLPVTAIQNLIRDPYVIYARYVLRLRRLDPLGHPPNALIRGTALHKVIEAFARQSGDKTEDSLKDTAAKVLKSVAPWPVSYLQWMSRIEAISPWLVELESNWDASGTIRSLEEEGHHIFEDLDFTLTAKPDRINEEPDGLIIVDYKSGALPTDKEVRTFDKQLPLTKLIAERGGFGVIKPVAALRYVSFQGALRDVDWDDADVLGIESGFVELLSHFLQAGTAFPSRTRPKYISYASDYDHLARRGEWADDATPHPQDLT